LPQQPTLTGYRSALPSGVHLYRLAAGWEIIQREMTIIWVSLGMIQGLFGILFVFGLASSDTATVNRFIRESTMMMDSRPDSALIKANEALRLSIQLEYREGQALARSRRGIARRLTGRTDSMVELEAALAMFKENRNNIQYGWTLINLSNLHIDNGEYVLGTERLHMALQLFTELDFKPGIAGAMVNLGEIRYELNQIEQGYALTQQGLALFDELDRPRDRSLALYQLARLKIRLNQAKDAIPLLMESLAISESLNDFRTMAHSHEALGSAYITLGNLDNALKSYHTSLDLRIQIHDHIDILASQIGIARVLFMKDDLTGAIPFATKAYTDAIRLNIPGSAAQALNLLYEIHKSTGDIQSALRYLEEYQTIQTDLVSVEKEKAISNLEAVAELRRKEDRIRFLEDQHVLERAILVAIILLFLFTAGFLVFVYRERQHVVDIAKKLERLGILKGQILSIVSHDIRGPLASLSTVIELLDAEILTADAWEEFKPTLIRQFNGTEETLNDLLLWSKSHFEGANPQIKPTSVRNAVAAGNELLDVVAREKGVVIVNDVSPEAMVMCNRSHLLAIFRNLVTNAVKFSKPGQTVTIQDGITDGMRIISVRDEGVGMSAERRDKLFEGPGFTTAGTAGELGSGLGLVFVRDLVQRNGGRISVDSTEGKGSVFTVALPMG